MAGYVDVNYFNTFLLKHTGDSNVFYIEESRIYGGYNNTSVDLGAKAFSLSEFSKSKRRSGAMIYSGPLNTRTGVNKSNEFSVAEDIVKGVNPSYGSIQKLYAEDSNLIVFQERKVSRALIDKDNIYSAEGSPMTTSSNVVIGEIVPYAGEYGISRDPESFAVRGYRKYFTDKNKGLVLRLSRDGITEISNTGMKSHFRDLFNDPFLTNVYGAYNHHDDAYILSVRNNDISDEDYSTVAFKESSGGWVSFYDYEFERGESYSGKFYTVNNTKIKEHDIIGSHKLDDSFMNHSVTTFINDEPLRNKTFKTVSYTGSTGWGITSLSTDKETGKPISSVEEGMYDSNLENPKIGKYGVNGLFNDDNTIKNDVVPPINYSGFVKKDNLYAAVLSTNESLDKIGIIPYAHSSGVKGDILEVIISKNTNNYTEGLSRIFNISTNFNVSNL